MKNGLLLFLLCVIQTFANAQGWVPAGGRAMSMGNASATFNDVWAYHNNPGALGDIEQFSVGISYENRFLLKEFQNQGLAIAIPLKVGVISIGGHFYGYSQFRSTKAGLGYSMKLSKKLFAGVQLNYQNLQLSQNYGSRSAMTAEAGIYAKITHKWKLGVSVFNLGRAKLSDFQDDRFSTIVRLGNSYQFSKRLLLTGEFEKNMDYDLRVKIGVEYEVIDHFFIRGGFASNPTDLTFGFGYRFQQIHLDLGSAYDRNLGWSPHFSIVFVGKK
ncbi:MAG: hypothetical protein COA33_005560 [Fluviicola sp.]|nr:hypothetical protein [Fluviicola sp.]